MTRKLTEQEQIEFTRVTLSTLMDVRYNYDDTPPGDKRLVLGDQSYEYSKFRGNVFLGVNLVIQNLRTRGIEVHPDVHSIGEGYSKWLHNRDRNKFYEPQEVEFLDATLDAYIGALAKPPELRLL